jgi:hypothetical protein
MKAHRRRAQATGRRLAGLGWALLACGLAGCGGEPFVRDEETVFAYPVWLGPLLVLLGLLTLPAAWQLRREKKPLGALALAILGPLAALALAPGAFLNHVTVGPDHFEVRYGFWWAPHYHFVNYDDLQSICILVETRQGGRGKTTIHTLEYVRRDGERSTIPLDADLRREAGRTIVQAAERRGVGKNP